MPNVTQEQIFSLLDTCETIPTLRKIREDLGGGSLETISRAVRAYRDARISETLSAMPDGVRTLCTDLGKKVWLAASGRITEAYSAAKAEAETQISAAEEELKRLEEENLRLVHKIEENANQTARILGENEQLRRSLAAVESKLEERDAAVSELRRQIDNMQKSIISLTAGKSAAEAELAAYKRMQETPGN